MWITFKSCIFAFWNNDVLLAHPASAVVNYIQILYLCILKQLIYSRSWRVVVVNYIQILYLCILKQLKIKNPAKSRSCELHSNLVSLHSETTTTECYNVIDELWITFKSCIFAFWNNLHSAGSTLKPVVNYIQILYLCILKQLSRKKPSLQNCCELHSNLVSLHSETTQEKRKTTPPELWITFKSCIFAFWNNFKAILKGWGMVVNYIQILYLCILKQPWDNLRYLAIVVNYIQILYLCILKQQFDDFAVYAYGCELHSNLVSLHSETTQRNVSYSSP